MGLIKRKRDKKRLKIGISNVKKEPLNERKVEEENYFYPDFIFKVLLIGHNDSGKITHFKYHFYHILKNAINILSSFSRNFCKCRKIKVLCR